MAENLEPMLPRNAPSPIPPPDRQSLESAYLTTGLGSGRSVDHVRLRRAYDPRRLVMEFGQHVSFSLNSNDLQDLLKTLTEWKEWLERQPESDRCRCIRPRTSRRSSPCT